MCIDVFLCSQAEIAAAERDLLQLQRSHSKLATMDVEERAVEAELAALIAQAEDLGARTLQRHWRGHATRRPPEQPSRHEPGSRRQLWPAAQPRRGGPTRSRAAVGPDGTYRPLVAATGRQPAAVRQFDVACRLSRGGRLDTAVLGFVQASLAGHPDAEEAAGLCAAALQYPLGSHRHGDTRARLDGVKDRLGQLSGAPGTRSATFATASRKGARKTSTATCNRTAARAGPSKPPEQGLWAFIKPTDTAAAAAVAEAAAASFLDLPSLKDPLSSAVERAAPVVAAAAGLTLEPASPATKRKQPARPSSGKRGSSRGCARPGSAPRRVGGQPGYAAPTGTSAKRGSPSCSAGGGGAGNSPGQSGPGWIAARRDPAEASAAAQRRQPKSLGSPPLLPARRPGSSGRHEQRAAAKAAAREAVAAAAAVEAATKEVVRRERRERARKNALEASQEAAADAQKAMKAATAELRDGQDAAAAARRKSKAAAVRARGGQGRQFHSAATSSHALSNALVEPGRHMSWNGCEVGRLTLRNECGTDVPQAQIAATAQAQVMQTKESTEEDVLAARKAAIRAKREAAKAAKAVRPTLKIYLVTRLK